MQSPATIQTSSAVRMILLRHEDALPFNQNAIVSLVTGGWNCAHRELPPHSSSRLLPYDERNHRKKCNISLMTRCRFQIITTIIMSAASTLIDHEVRVYKCDLSLAMHTGVLHFYWGWFRGLQGGNHLGLNLYYARIPVIHDASRSTLYYEVHPPLMHIEHLYLCLL